MMPILQSSKSQKANKEATEQMLKENDILLFPTTPTTAFKIGEINDPIQMYLQDIFTVHANIVGVPAVSLPMGLIPTIYLWSTTYE